MKAAAIYDVHGNVPALEAVLADVFAEEVDVVVVGGDVLPGPMPREALRLLFDLTVTTRFIVGNGEVDTLAIRAGEELARVPERFHDAMRWVGDALRAEEIERIARWPLTWSLEVPGLGDVLFCHATPRDENEIFTRLTPEERLRPIFERTKADIVVCGHTHMQFDRRVGDVRVVNAGSVGMPFGEPGAFWALLGPDGVELRRTPYDFIGATERVGATGYPGAAALQLLEPPSEDQMLGAFEAVALRE